MSDPWFKFYASDWLAGTRGLTAAETGVYVTLIAMMYERGEDIPRDDVRLSRLCGCPKASFTRSLNALIDEGKVTEKDGGLSNDRVEKERQWRVEKSQKASVSASRRWASHADKSEPNQQKPNANAVNSQCDLDANQIPEPEPDKIDTSVSTKKPNPSKPKRACSIPDGWVPNDRNIQDATDRSFSQQEITHEANQFRDFHLAKGTTYKDWNAAWRTWLGNAIKYRASGVQSSNGRRMGKPSAAEENANFAVEYARSRAAGGGNGGGSGNIF